jgi:predicted AAA+ superfamily ATPase
LLHGVQQGLTPITALQGPPQVEKIIFLKHVVKALLEQDVRAQRIFLVPCNALPALQNIMEPILELTQWYAATLLKKSLNQAAHDGEQAYIFLNEVQSLSDWAPQLKHLVDMQPVRVLVTSSVNLSHAMGRTSLAGRISIVEIGPA